jgi:hypothetical protein
LIGRGFPRHFSNRPLECRHRRSRLDTIRLEFLRKVLDDPIRQRVQLLLPAAADLIVAAQQELFDCLLRPAVENPQVTRIEFVLDEDERANWRDHVVPKLAACRGREKVIEPRWCTLHESVSFVLGDRDADGQAEAQLSFWGEPFMARTTGRDVPRYIFHVHAHSELVPRLVELARTDRMAP